MLKGNRWMILLNMALFGGFIGYAVNGNEKILAHGQDIFLELAPKDPRSLMQGDYMQLTYRFADIPMDKLRSMPTTGFCVLRLDPQKVGSVVRYQSHRTPLNRGEWLIPFHNNHEELTIGASSFFFQEGLASRYDMARYGHLKVDQTGHVLLVGLRDSTLKPLP